MKYVLYEKALYEWGVKVKPHFGTFKTEDEAIDYAKELAKYSLNGMSFVLEGK